MDLPGVSDGNRLREAVTREYLERCDLCIVVSKADRAIADEEVRRSLRSLARDKGTDSLLMVCTESDVSRA